VANGFALAAVNPVTIIVYVATPLFHVIPNIMKPVVTMPVCGFGFCCGFSL
jgi:hypothetical protein